MSTTDRTLLLLAEVMLVPQILLAQDTTWIDNVGKGLYGLLQLAIPVLISLAVLLFIWGGVTFIWGSGNEEKVAEGRKRIVWGIVALFVIMAAWGLVQILQVVFGVTGTEVPPAPGITVSP